MDRKIQRLRADVAKKLDGDKVSLTAYRDYDFDRRMTDMQRLSRAVSHFSVAVTQGMVAMKEIANSFEAVGQAFTEMTQGTVNTMNNPNMDEVNPFPTENDMQNLASFNEERNEGYAPSMASTRLTGETNGQVRRLAKIFAEETRRMNEGPPFQSYNAGMHRDVVVRLLPVTEHLKSVEEYSEQRTDALIKYNRYKAEVEKVEKQYAKKGKPFCDSRSHKKYTAKRDKAWQEYIVRRDKFNETFLMLMEVNDHAAAQIIHRYLALNDEYLHHLIESIGRIRPAMEEAYPLNFEYTTAQNNMILEAVAQAKIPFKHYHHNPNDGTQLDARFNGVGAAYEPSSDDDDAATSDLPSVPNSDGPHAQNQQPEPNLSVENAQSVQHKKVPTNELGEPDDRDQHQGVPGNALHQRPSSEVTGDGGEADTVGGAENTTEDTKHLVAQQHRLKVGEGSEATE